MDSGSGVLRTGEVSLSEYFREQLAIHAQELEPQPREDTCWYLGNLLVRFSRSENFFAYEDGRSTLRPLALLYSDALDARNEYERCLLLQQLGDLSLFLGALYPKHYVPPRPAAGLPRRHGLRAPMTTWPTMPAAGATCSRSWLARSA
ncbi:MAG: hypothetical protein IPG64_22120 [Haliea sp.]|nr:hypothetical protein [Haliea sp.]